MSSQSYEFSSLSNRWRHGATISQSMIARKYLEEIEKFPPDLNEPLDLNFVKISTYTISIENNHISFSYIRDLKYCRD